MRGAAVSVVILGVALGSGAAGRQDEKAAIMEVVERQAAAFWAKDFDRWSDTWVHADYVRRVGWSPTGGVISVEGWDAIGGAMKKLMTDNPAPNQTPSSVVRDRINVHVYRDVAWLTFDQHAKDTGEARFDMPGVSH